MENTGLAVERDKVPETEKWEVSWKQKENDPEKKSAEAKEMI